MKIRIGNIWFDPVETPMVIFFDEDDKKILKTKFNKYITVPKSLNWNKKQIQKFSDGEYLRTTE